MQGPSPAAAPASGAWLGGFRFQTQVLWTFPQVRVSVPSGLLLAAAKLLKPPASLQLPAPLCREGGRWRCGSRYFPSQEATNGHPASPAIIALTLDALCKLSRLLSSRGAAQGERRSGAFCGDLRRLALETHCSASRGVRSLQLRLGPPGLPHCLPLRPQHCEGGGCTPQQTGGPQGAGRTPPLGRAVRLGFCLPPQTGSRLRPGPLCCPKRQTSPTLSPTDLFRNPWQSRKRSCLPI